MLNIYTPAGTVLPDVLTTGQLCSTPPKNILFGAVGLLSSIDYINKAPAQLNLVEILNQVDGIPAYMVSFDIFKAYDKTVVDYICRVMEGMSSTPPCSSPRSRCSILSVNPGLF